MKLKQAAGNTWYLEDWQDIPLYKTSDSTCVLLDTGFRAQRDAIEQTLAKNGLRPVGILGSHIHVDHSANHRYFQQKYDIPVALSAGEAGIAMTPLNLQAYYFYMLHPQQPAADDDVTTMLVEADRMIMPREDAIDFCGAHFEILHTPGHTPDHISILTPDNVLYLGDAILTGKNISNAKLPYFFSVQRSIASMEMLRETHFDYYLAAHKGVYTDIKSLADECICDVKACATRILDGIDCGLTRSEIVITACTLMKMLSSKPRKVAFYERNVHIYVDYLVDVGALEIVIKNGVEFYRKTGKRP
ncbi:MAG: MBL fold metallo-hydrolase [Peptococcaceae bacterium]|nr:MBL fold metallo-hydrolase [Peptococcaceae bacterium]